MHSDELAGERSLFRSMLMKPPLLFTHNRNGVRRVLEHVNAILDACTQLHHGRVGGTCPRGHTSLSRPSPNASKTFAERVQLFFQLFQLAEYPQRDIKRREVRAAVRTGDRALLSVNDEFLQRKGARATRAIGSSHQLRTETLGRVAILDRKRLTHVAGHVTEHTPFKRKPE